MRHKRVIWRTIGQSIAQTEAQLRPYRADGLEIVRYSPMERNIPGYIGEDALIRFFKDPDIYTGWTGEKAQIITIAQQMKMRAAACSYDFFEKTTRRFPRKLIGPGSEKVGDWGLGRIPYEQLLEELRQSRAYFYTGTHPASYTLNFIEAWMMGIPLVAVGAQYGNPRYFPGHVLYEINHLVQNHYDGFVSDSSEELASWIDQLLRNIDLAKLISANARGSAIKYFGKQVAAEKWKGFLG